MNTCALSGRLTADPEAKQSGSGTAYATGRLAVKKRMKDETFFVPFTVFGKTSEVFLKHFKKGDAIEIVGSLDIREYEKDGEKKSFTSIEVSDISFPVSNKAPDAAPSAPASAPAATRPSAPARGRAPAPQPPPDDDSVPF